MFIILVIDRDAQLLHLLTEWLTLYGFHPITANTTHEGYELAYLERPDLILCGYGFPSFDGLRLLQALRSRSDTANIPFLLMTGALLEDIPDWQTHLQQGELLLKPFDLNFLIQILRSKLGHSHPSCETVVCGHCLHRRVSTPVPRPPQE